MGKKKKNILVVGGGCSGHMAALLLDEKFNPYVLEADSRWGGHDDTQRIQPGDIAVDAGAAFINRQYCPNLYKLLNHYKISLLSFTLVTHYYMQSKNIDIILPPVYLNDKNHLNVEWGSLLSWTNIKIMLQMQIVLNKAKSLINEKNTEITIEAFLNTIKVGPFSLISHSFKKNFLYPLIANAYFVDQPDYEINELTDDTLIKKNHLYVCPKGNRLHYSVMTPEGDIVHDSIGLDSIGLNKEHCQLADIQARKAEILELTCQNKHTFKPDPNKTIKKFSAYAAFNYLYQGYHVKCGRWQELEEGLAKYLEEMRKEASHTHFLLEHPVMALNNVGTDDKPKYSVRLADESLLMEDGEPVIFDAVVLATNGQQAGEILATLPSHADIGQRLKDLRYYKTRVDVFGETSQLPAKIRTVNSDGDNRQILFLEPRAKEPENPIFRTTNREVDCDDQPLYHAVYLHPFLDPDFYCTSEYIRKTNGTGNIWVAGAIADGGDSQENAINAGLQAAREITRRFKVPFAQLFGMFNNPEIKETPCHTTPFATT